MYGSGSRMLKNPILKGFKPDPSILRVEDTYYIATSTFEWHPPINLFRSTDLANWEQIASPNLNLDLRGIDSSCGLWAPNLSYHDRRFYLVCTVVQTNRRRFKDPHNFIASASCMEGPWSEPVLLNKSGWDPSLFFEDERCYLLNMLLDWRPERNRFAGVVLQELDLQKQTLVGEVQYLTAGTATGSTEAPNLYKQDGFYYLLLAEGGTEFGHQVSVLRSSSLLGPYEESPCNPLVKSKSADELQRAGHGSLVKTQEGRIYLAYLCSRSVDGAYSILGRETALAEVVWNSEGWPVLSGQDSHTPQVEVPSLPQADQGPLVLQFDFQNSQINHRMKTLREPFSKCGMDFLSRAGWLRIHGGNSLSSRMHQHLLAISQETLDYQVTTLLDFKPRSPWHLAGLLAYYDADNYFYAYQSTDDQKQPILGVVEMDNMVLRQVGEPLHLQTASAVYLRATARSSSLVFSFSLDGTTFIDLHTEKLDMRHLSDEHIQGNGFTGAMVGIGCQDLAGDGIHADFAYLRYEQL